MKLKNLRNINGIWKKSQLATILSPGPAKLINAVFIHVLAQIYLASSFVWADFKLLSNLKPTIICHMIWYDMVTVFKWIILLVSARNWKCTSIQSYILFIYIFTFTLKYQNSEAKRELPLFYLIYFLRLYFIV